MRYPITESALNEMAKVLVQRMKQEIKKKQFPYAPGFRGGRPTTGTGNKYASGNLYNSLSYSIVITNGQPGIELQYADYFEYVNRGVKPKPQYLKGNGGGGGTSPFIAALLKWISIRGIKPKGYAGKGRYNKASKLGLALAIRKNIFRYGIAPARFYDVTYESMAELFINPPNYLKKQYDKLFEAMGDDVDNLFTNILNENE